MTLKKLIVFACVVFLFVSGFLLYTINQYPDPANLSRSNGMIHHPKYGSYPERVEFKQGMTLMPGQIAEGIIEIEMLKKEE